MDLTSGFGQHDDGILRSKETLVAEPVLTDGHALSPDIVELCHGGFWQ
jgi:hypothetical protein